MEAERNTTNIFAKNCISTALIKLMGEKDYEDITITDIAKKAGVSRVTYYRNYTSKEDIIIKHFDEINHQFHKRVQKLDPINNMYECLVNFFQIWLKHSDFLLCLIKGNLTYLLLDSVNNFTRSSLNSAHKYHAFFYTGSIHNILFEWVKDGAKESAEEMAAILCDMIQPPPSILALD